MRYRELVRAGGVEALPGAIQWVQRLQDLGWPQAIASSAPRLNVEAVLDALGLRDKIQTSVAAEDVQMGKPAPEVFLTAAARLAVEPQNCIVVEDAYAGVEGARRAGMRSIGVGRNSMNLGADLAVATLADLPPDAFDSLLRLEPCG